MDESSFIEIGRYISCADCQVDTANQKEEIVCKTDRQAIVRIGLAAELNESVVNAFSNSRVLCYVPHSTYKELQQNNYCSKDKL